MRECSYNPPDEALEALARCLLPAIQSYFESEEGQREFEEWKKSRLDAEQRPHLAVLFRVPDYSAYGSRVHAIHVIIH